MKIRIAVLIMLVSLVSTLALNRPASARADDRAASASALPPPRPATGGLMIGWHEDGDDLEKLRTHEQVLGKRFAIVRTYQQWQLPNRKVDALVNDGRLVLVSHKPPLPSEGGWAAVANGREDKTIRALARKYRSYGRQIVFTFHHEPHDDASDLKRSGLYGRSSAFKAAWRRIHKFFVAEGAAAAAGGNVYFGYVATSNWMLRGSPPGSADQLYPGDEYVDLFAHDKYDWGSCRGEPSVEFADMWAPILDLAAAHRKYVIPAEWGAAPAGGRRNEWFRRAAHFMKTDSRARQWMIGFAYYHSFHDDCHWDFLNQKSDGKPGWISAFSADPYFVGQPFAIPGETRTAATQDHASSSAVTPQSRPPATPGPRWRHRSRQVAGLPPGTGEMSGLAASRRYPGWMWGVRDSGNPASLYALRAKDDRPGEFDVREFHVPGTRNRDWEDIVYGQDAGGGYLAVVDEAARLIYKVAEPDPSRPGSARLLTSYPYRFPDSSPRGTCGPRDNVEAAFLFPPLTGQLHIVRKASAPAGVYAFHSLSSSKINVPALVGRLPDAGCISVAAVSADGRRLVTASHDTLRVRQGNGDLRSLLVGPVDYTASVKPDNNEAGTFFPYGGNDFVLGAENRTTWLFR
jgi:hypothetical protein